MRRSAATVSAVLLLLGAGSACELDEVPIAPSDPVIVVHGVLSSGVSSQVVLLERSLAGRTFVPNLPHTPRDPIISGGGIPISDAEVSLTLPDGRVVFAREDRLGDPEGLGAGVYRFLLPGSALVGGGVYRLRAVTTSGEEITAETVVPAGESITPAVPRTYDRQSGPLALSWEPLAGVMRYVVRVESAFGPFTTWTDGTGVELDGGMRHADVDGFPRVFLPGHGQTVTVLAVDANYYDWFRSANRPWSGAGVISRITGGIGVFGSAVRLHQQMLHVTAPRTRPVEGRYTYHGTALDQQSSIARVVDLYVESPATGSDQPDAISGRYTTVSGVAGGVMGTFRNGELRIAFLRGIERRDTLDVFTGTLRGDTLDGKYRNYGVSARFVRELQ